MNVEIVLIKLKELRAIQEVQLLRAFRNTRYGSSRERVKREFQDRSEALRIAIELVENA